ncbi:MAG: hypothetical protein DA330_00970 [Nitrososphaera sp.]|nr:hypothetical protein [Nitrososphaera sp.]
MSMKCCIVSAVAGTGTPPFTQDFTNSDVFGGATPKAAIILGGGAGSADTATDGLSFQLGFSDGTNQSAIAFAGDTSTSTNSTARSNRANAGYVHLGVDGTVDGAATISLIANGGRLTWSDQSTGETIYVLLIGGDIEAAVVNVTGNGSGSAQTVTHGLSAAPELIIALDAWAAENTDTGGDTNGSIGFWTASTQLCAGQRLRDGQSTAASSGQINTAFAFSAFSTAGGIVYEGAISNVGSSSFDMTTAPSTTNNLHFLSLRSTSGTALSVAAGVGTAKTSTGTQSDISGMTNNPQVLLVLPTALTSADLASSTDTSGNFGLGISCKRSSDGVTQYMGVVSSADDGDATTADWLNHQHSAAKHLHVLDADGVTSIAATVSSWVGGIEHNYTTASGVATKFPYLAFGADAVTGNAARARYYEMMRTSQ